MARKPINSIDWMQKNIDEIFAEPIKEIESSSSPHINVHEKIEQFERKARLNFNKNRPAPPPPGTQIVLPKIGNYKPKILLSRNNSKAAAPKSPYDDVRIQETEKIHRERQESFTQSVAKNSSPPEPNSECNIHNDDCNIYSTIDMKPDYDTDRIDQEERKCMIIGDKDTPLILESTYFGGDDENKGKSYISIDNIESAEGNDFFVDHSAMVNVGEVVVNPLFEDKKKEKDFKDKLEPSTDFNKHTYKKRRAPAFPSSYINRHRHNSHTSHESDEEYPYIPEPEPDYDEEEATMNFEGDLKRNKYGAARHNNNVMKDYGGDDFAKYMDDDDGFHEQTFTWRKNIRHVKKSSPQKQHPVPKSKRVDSSSINTSKLKPIKKPKHAETQHGSIKRQTLRDISYADCKIGIDDRTVRSVKSTSAGGRYVKRGKERTMIVDGDSGSGGYEEFLRMRHKAEGSLESNSSGDSGLDTGDDIFQQEQFFYKMQPKKVRQNNGKGTLWEKLTWRFKRHVGGYRMS